jgi:hypothetical protein
MTIPTKGDLAQNKANAAAAAAAARVPADVKFFTDEIVKAMQAGKNFYSHQTMNVSPAVLAQLQADFAKSGWTITVSNARTGCSISWK